MNRFIIQNSNKKEEHLMEFNMMCRTLVIKNYRKYKIRFECYSKRIFL